MNQSNIPLDTRCHHPGLKLTSSDEVDYYIASTIAEEANRLESIQPILPQEGRLSFRQLPLEVHVGILKHLVILNGPVHVLSRLDAFETGCDDLLDEDGEVRLINKFHVGTSRVSLATATDPQTLLAPLLACQMWHYLGSTIFYGRNTFAFSSLGE